MPSDTPARTVRAVAFRPHGQPSPAGLPDYQEQTMQTYQLHTDPGINAILNTFGAIGAVTGPLFEARSIASLLVEVLEATDRLPIEMDSGGLLEVFRSIRGKLDAASDCATEVIKGQVIKGPRSSGELDRIGGLRYSIDEPRRISIFVVQLLEATGEVPIKMDSLAVLEIFKCIRDKIDAARDRATLALEDCQNEAGRQHDLLTLPSRH